MAVGRTDGAGTCFVFGARILGRSAGLCSNRIFEDFSNSLPLVDRSLYSCRIGGPFLDIFRTFPSSLVQSLLKWFVILLCVFFFFFFFNCHHNREFTECGTEDGKEQHGCAMEL
jgi:hypothetical protein